MARDDRAARRSAIAATGRETGRVAQAQGVELQAESLPPVVHRFAERAWVPHAIMVNPNLRWRAIDERSAEVSTKLANEWIALRLSFDDGGDLKRTSAQRPRLERPDLGKRLTSPTRVTMSLPHRHS